MLATITATKAKNRFGEVIRRVYKNGETLLALGNPAARRAG
jgi:antitoxin (DNA-binding transcriptional repressor) of toxin-antitoxin stability system